MRMLILIRKIMDEGSIHYYNVFKENNLEDINYVIGLDTKQSKILFFESYPSSHPLCTYNVNLKKFETIDSKLYPLINLRVIANASKTILKNEFPQSISWEG